MDDFGYGAVSNRHPTERVKALTVTDLHRVARQILPRIVESPWIPEGEIILMNDLNLPTVRPAEFETLNVKEKLDWAVKEGWTILIRGNR